MHKQTELRDPAGFAASRGEIALGAGPNALPVRAAGAGWLVVEKPAGMSMHNLPGRDLLSLADAGLKANEWLLRQVAADPGFGVHAPHRLDRETSGVVLVALTARALRHLADQFSSRNIAKKYHALVHGCLALDEGREGELTWGWGLAREAGGSRFPAGRGPKQPCRTLVRPLASSRHYTLVCCQPVTGRKHQIRRHAKIAGHPVVGDRRYASRRAVRYLEVHCGFSRLALHAEAITFVPPGQPAATTVCSTGLPPEIAQLFHSDRT